MTTLVAPEQTGFLRSIIENPFDDTVRLIYADWLEEHGEGARAEFIRLQFQIEKTHRGKKHRGIKDSLMGIPVVLDHCRCRWCALKKRERKLLEGTRPVDWSGFPAGVYQPGQRPAEQGLWVFERGFVQSITITLGGFIYHAPAVFAATPITAVHLSDRIPQEGAFGLWSWIGVESAIPTDPNFTVACCSRPSMIPDTLWEHLPGIIPYGDFNVALKALSRACVEYGRSLVRPELPRLEWPKERGQKSSEGQRSEVIGRSEVRSQRSEVRGQRSLVTGPLTSDF
jgi:uncharacterized protein (TIGR02996 family)